MGEMMSLQQVRDAMLEEKAWARGTGWPMAAGTLQRWADAIDAHLTQPAQTVDAGAIREVIRQMRNASTDVPSREPLLGYYIELLTAALPNANGKEDCQHEWEQVTERGKFCVHCGQIITHATFEYVPPQEDTPDAAR